MRFLLLPFFPQDSSAAENISSAPPAADDAEMATVRKYLLREDPTGERFATVLRDTIDQLLDGEHTGRFDWNDLHKTEKTHAGTLIEINLLREFNFASGHDMDYLISGIEVDCKFSQRNYQWMIPPEALGEICLVVWADDHKSKWSAGLLRADREKLTTSGKITKKGNRDGKFRLTKEHHSLVQWIWEDKELEENLLLHIDPERLDFILTAGSSSRRSPGQAKVSELFRRVQHRRINRTVVRTLAQQKDYMKRVRYNGGSRGALQKEGILIFGDYPNHQTAAEQLGLPVPQEGEFVSARVVEAQPRHGSRVRALMDGRYWVVADSGDEVQEAPLLPETKKKKSN
ncbi:NaeI family type II restriction endonuclease [Streptomyces sp. NPDC048161]|uniref:NaeI family type II restriction endonuclease n=1 Tax=Streptomyces sp. NPDC048161 TaxID=3160985 RepID=UPI0033C3CA2F